MSDALDVLLADGVIDEVLGRLKSGKEADISLVRRGEDVLAAKVYKDRATRSFKNNADYKEGRKVRNTRTQRAMDGGGRFGRDAAEQAWKSAEADTLYRLVGSGVRVPTPVMFYEGVLLMELVKDAEGRPAPRLIDVAIEPAAALGVYADLVVQSIALLCCDLIHGDLSPYNILAAADGPTIIDFPQVVSAVHSSRAEFFFLRDFDNLVRFVSGFDPSLAVHHHDGRAIWRAYVRRELTREFVPPPPPPPPRSGPSRWREPRGDSRSGPPRGDSRSGPPRGDGPPDRRWQGGPDPRSSSGGGRSTGAPGSSGRRSSGDPARPPQGPWQDSRRPPSDPRRSPGPQGGQRPQGPPPSRDAAHPGAAGPGRRAQPAPRSGAADPGRRAQPGERTSSDRGARPASASPARGPARSGSSGPAAAPGGSSEFRGHRRRPKRHW